MTTPPPCDPPAAAVAKSLLAALWRENVADLRQRAVRRHDRFAVPVPGGTLSFTGAVEAFDQLCLTGPPRCRGRVVDDPAALLRLVTDCPAPLLAAELTDAVAGLRLARRRRGDVAADIVDLARRRHAATLIDLAAALGRQSPTHAPCRLFEPLATAGHHLHPCARTRLGWTDADRAAYDVETTQPFSMRFVSARLDAVTCTPHDGTTRLDRQLAADHPQLQPHLRRDRVLVPVHPWQHQHVLVPRLHQLYRDGALVDVPEASLPVTPTASVRTLVTDTGAYLKCSLDIQITSTRRGISPATAANGPALSTALCRVVDDDAYLAARLRLLREPAAVSLPARRDLTCILRQPLRQACRPEETPVPAMALTARSPLSGDSVLTEILAAHAHAGGTATTFLRAYADILIGPCLHLAGSYGIGLEAHLQNCAPAFVDGAPVAMIVRDLGGLRLHRARMQAAAVRPRLHPQSVVVTDDLDVMRAKVAYTVFQNHFFAVADEVNRICASPPQHAWDIAAETMTSLDLPACDLAFYTAATIPHKALTTMRLHDGPDQHVPVSNPLHRPAKAHPHA